MLNDVVNIINALAANIIVAVIIIPAKQEAAMY
jgi:hypothetical protein